MAHPVDCFVYRAFLFDIGIRPRNIGFRLVIIIIRHEIFDGVVRKEILELAIKLRRQNLVWRQDQGGPLQFFNHLGHREGLARSGHPEQHLIALLVAHPGDQLLDRSRLIASRLKIADQLEWSSTFRFFGTIGLVRHEIFAGLGLRQASSDYQFCHNSNMEQKGSNVIPVMEFSAQGDQRKFTSAVHPFMQGTGGVNIEGIFL